MWLSDAYQAKAPVRLTVFDDRWRHGHKQTHKKSLLNGQKRKHSSELERRSGVRNASPSFDRTSDAEKEAFASKISRQNVRRIVT